MMKVDISSSRSFITLQTNEGSFRFHAIWLRDNALDENTRDPRNGQRLITLQDIPKDITLDSAIIEDNEILCTFSPENKIIRYSIKWLLNHAYDNQKNSDRIKLESENILWDKELQKEVPQCKISELENDSILLKKWLFDIHRYGFAKVNGMSGIPDEIFRIVDLFGYVRETNYGRHFEVRTEVNPVNLAYTGLALQAHTDNPYRDPVPTLQILSCVENSTEGGESMVVDGYKIAMDIYSEDPEGFSYLTKFPARFSYDGSKEVSLKAKKPMIELSPDNELRCIRFNSRSTAPLVDIPFNSMEKYYEAYRRFAELVDMTQNQVAFKLKPGEAFIVDNTRVLHSRKEYSGSGKRWLQGCYADKDSLLSKLRSLENLNVR